MHPVLILAFATLFFFFLTCVVRVKEFLFWLYVVQLKEYRWDKIKDYLTTKEAKNTLFSKRFLLRCLLVIVFSIVICCFIQWLIPLVLVVCGYIFAEVLLIAKHLWKKTLRTPKRTKRIWLMMWWWILFFVLSLYVFFYGLQDLWAPWVFIWMIIALLCMPVYVFVLWLATDWLFLWKKKRLFQLAKQRMLWLTDLTTIWISGSFWKSSVKFLLTHILWNERNVAFPPDNINSEVGVSQYVMHWLPDDAAYFVTEFGTYGIWETALLGEITQHTHGFLTWLNNQHEALFGSLEQAIAAETEVIPWIVTRGGTLYANRDNQYVREVVYPADLNLITYSTKDSSADAISVLKDVNPGHTSCEFSYKKWKFTYTTDLIGEHALLNLTWVLACCLDTWMTPEWLIPLLKQLQAYQKTTHVHHVGTLTLIDDTYNINQDGAVAGCHAARQFGKPVVVVMDDILELGSSSWDTHVMLWTNLANIGISHIFLTGKEFAPAVKKWLHDAWYEKDIIALYSVWKKKFIDQLEAVADEVTIVFLGRMTWPFFDHLMK